jgi:hypothetical protein
VADTKIGLSTAAGIYEVAANVPLFPSTEPAWTERKGHKARMRQKFSGFPCGFAPHALCVILRSSKK